MLANRKTVSAALPAIVAAALVIRIVFLLGVDAGPSHQLSPGMDEVNYRELAANILDFHRFQAYSEGFLASSTRAPGYPTILACFYRLFGRDDATSRILNIVFDALNTALIFFLAALLYDAVTGLCAAGFHAIFAPTFIYLPMSTPEIVSVTLILGVCAATAALSRQRSYGKTLFPFAFILAFLIHTRPVFLLTLPVIGIALFLDLKGTPSRRRLLKSAIPLALVLALCVPWAIRNYQRHQALVPVCALAGWHVISSAREQSELSIDDVMDYIYNPARRGYTEGEYFKEAMDLSFQECLKHPFRIVFAGVARLVHAWTPPGPWYRFALPKAYAMPVVFGDSFWLPFPDFEGFIYACAAISVIFLIFRSRRGRRGPRVVGWFRRSRSTLLIVIAYALAHIAGIPLTQYRFMIEPTIVILGFGLLRHCLISSPPIRPSTFISGGVTCFLYGLTAALALAIAIPLAYRDAPTHLPYPENDETVPGHLDFKQLRELQWNSLGRVGKSAKADLTGVVKYLKDDCRFVPNASEAVIDKGRAVGKLYVNYRKQDNPMGVGDVKLNFSESVPEDGELIRVRGPAHTGKFRDLIIDVEQWNSIGDQ